jgi:hypothetical protein
MMLRFEASIREAQGGRHATRASLAFTAFANREDTILDPEVRQFPSWR